MGAKIMFVDDEEDIRLVVKTLLSKNGYKPVICSNGKECLKKISRGKPDLLLLDIMMPGLSGWEICSRIKSDPKTEDIPIIFLTAKSDDISRQMGLQGADDFIAKPFDPEELLEKISKHIK